MRLCEQDSTRETSTCIRRLRKILALLKVSTSSESGGSNAILEYRIVSTLSTFPNELVAEDLLEVAFVSSKIIASFDLDLLEFSEATPSLQKR